MASSISAKPSVILITQKTAESLANTEILHNCTTLGDIHKLVGFLHLHPQIERAYSQFS
jgi:hypothetical protein